jgi:putative ABC transport system permease protein
MRLLDSTGMAFTAIVRYPLRSSMLLVAIAIGVSAVLILTSLGEGARRYVTEQFSSLGTHLLMVTPGKNEVGGLGGMAGGLGHSPRPLTLQDAMALQRSIHISTVTALTVGTGSINFRGVEREVDVVGTTSTQQQLFKYEVIKGRFIPEMDMDNTSAIAVIGHTIAGELFGTAEPVGKWVRLGDLRVRVIGVLAQTGQSGGRDMDDTVLVPVGFAMQMYNRESIHRLMIEAVNADAMGSAEKDILEIIKARHRGHDDITVVNQGAVLDTFNTIFLVLTSTLGGIAGISLMVAGTLIMNVMLVAVSQRTQEIGLIKALGGRRRQIVGLFLTEAAILSVFGALLGVFVGQAAIGVMRELYPLVDFQAPTWAVAAAVLMAVTSGLLFGIMPARRAASLDPVEALAGH